ncbi:class I SAM-dependent methyltransferase [Candidatus Chloroploca asiatica]|uniref:SAM-dependent methyltransferase n=1 Tax=Candidatus Chloroploca asiatica TaxID=1506545 RepID=A0A2H3L4Y8_9CHLR|nr:class I SAM-dependent methyltransferase [Candidatus Chloroploca asiatica]PDV98246.1 SAM-dependent methyltransferase [Candidatus Chloroploca asiatica]
MPELHLLAPPPWREYALLDTGGGARLERFGSYTLVRPDTQAIWPVTLTEQEWLRADATFAKARSGDDTPGHWVARRQLPEQWPLHYDNLAFWVRPTPFRHTGIFPEHSAHWPWLADVLARSPRPSVLVLFGYTGLTSIYAAAHGAAVTHVDASKPAVRWAQDNQRLSGLEAAPIRWLVDDVGKFVAREIRRGRHYDLIVMDPPVFGRGPKGEIWRLNEHLPELVAQCVQLLSDQSLGLLLNAYATNVSALTLYNLLTAAFSRRSGSTSAGELTLREERSGRLLPTALYACWSDVLHPHQVQSDLL